MKTALLIAALALAAGALAYALWCRRREKRTLQTLEAMLEAAIRGDFSEETFDESLLSAVEAKLAQYLSASLVSARNLGEEKEKIKTLIGDISHQTKTPIANILLYAQLLGEQDLPAESRAMAAALEGQAEKLDTLIQALVKLSRLETGVLALHPAAGPVWPAVSAAAEQVRPKAAEKGITLCLRPSREWARLDPKWTEEAVYNLLDNGVKYTPAGGQVTVSVTPYELFCRVDVTDTGPGIPEREQAKIFGRFYRAPGTYETQGGGIGLYLVRQIAAGQGGYVKVSSQPEQGSTFSLFLPRG